MGARAALLSLLLALAASAPLPFAPGRVLQLSLDSFDAELARGPYLVYVGTEWCSHCQRLKPHFAEAALALQGHTACAFVDASAERVLQTRLGVRGYPSVFLFRDGAMRSYSGARTASALVAWARAGYADTPVAPFHKTPNNALGRLLGRVLRLPAAAARGAVPAALRRPRVAASCVSNSNSL